MDFITTSSTVSSNDERRSMFSQMAERLICVVLTCIFAIVGLLAGAITGALTGLATESGLFRGAGIGAISGAVFSIEIDILASLLSGRLVREKVDPAVQSAVQSHMSAVNDPLIEFPDIFETGGTEGMSKDSVSRLGKIKISKENNVNASGEKISCSVCLQEFQNDEMARCLPHCQHMFHLQCIDNWLIRHASCPLCRQDVSSIPSFFL